jgi:Zn-dependent protease with chaperone function
MFLLIIMAFAPTFLRAQADNDDDDDADVPFANLTVNYDARGAATVTFYAFELHQGITGVEAALEDAFHCPAGSLENPPPRPYLPKYLKSRPASEQQQYQKRADEMRANTLQGACQAAMTRTGFLLSTDIHLTVLDSVLERHGVKQVWVQITHPKSKFTEHIPEGRVPPVPDDADPRSVRSELYTTAFYRVEFGKDPPSTIHIAFGLRNRDAIRAAILPAVFLLTPVLICIWMRRAAIRDASIDPIGAWFSYMRVLIWSGNSLFIIWLLGQTVRKGLEDLTSYYTSAHNAAGVASSVAIFIVPPWITYLICILLSYRVYVQVRGEKWTFGEFIASNGLTLAAQFLPLMCFIAALQMLSINEQASMMLFIGVYVSYKVCIWLKVKITGTHLEPLTTGELRDRVFAIARKAVVEIRQVFIMPAGKSQMANAFASRSRYVFFTDYLLRRLNKREVSAVAAHEVAHIQKRHSFWSGISLVLLLLSPQILFGVLSALVGFLHHSLSLRRAVDGPDAGSGLATIVHFGNRVLAFPELILILYVIALALFFLQSRFFEHAADAGAVQLSDDPEAVITSLLKLGRLNLTPVQWDRATGSILTHPSTLRRVQKVAAIAQISSQRLDELLRESRELESQPLADDTDESVDRFAEERPRDPVVTVANAAQMLEFKKWVLRFFYIAPPGLIAFAVHSHFFHLPALAFVVGGVASLILMILISESQSLWERASLRSKLLARLTSQGIDVKESFTQVVDLNPHAGPRSYAVGFHWDTGMLLFARNLLCYSGDEIQFALRPDQVLAVRLGPGIPQWISEPRVYVDWQAEPGAPFQSWNLSPKDPCSILKIRRQVRDLYASLQRWKIEANNYPDAPAQLRELAAPTIGEVTGNPIKSIVTFQRYLKVALFNQILAIVVCMALRIPSAWYVCLLDLLMVTYSFSPFWFYKNREGSREVVPAPVYGSP